jgi:endonuclease YncB( thermonuclease family)
MRALFIIPMIILAGTSLAQAPPPGKTPAAPSAAATPAQAPPPAPPAKPSGKPSGKPSDKPSGKPQTVSVTPPKKAPPKKAPPKAQWSKVQGVNHLLVSTGDTVQANGQTLKLYGIFAPSFQRRCEHHSAMRSRNGLLALVSHHRITMQRREGNQTRIKLLAGGHDVANLMVAHGLAVRGKQRPRFC